MSSLWGTTPVLDGGRIMPLDSFARQIVTEICGEPEPVFVLDDSVLVELNQIVESLPKADINPDVWQTLDTTKKDSYRFLTPGIDVQQFDSHSSFLKEKQPEVSDSKEAALYGITSRIQGEQIIRRIRALTSAEGQRFRASELLLSWLTESEVWEFIPIFPAENVDYREEVLGVSLRNNSKVRLRRVSLHQLKCSQRFQQRLVDIARKQQLRRATDIPNLYDQITENIAAHRQSYENLTFHPLLYRPTRMLGLLHQSVADSAGRNSSYTAALETWGYLLGLGESPDLQSVEIPAGTDTLAQKQLHPTTERWHEIAVRIQVLAAAFDRADEYTKATVPNLTFVEKQFDKLLDLISANLEESEALMEKIYPGTAYRFPAKGKDATDAEKLLSRLFLPDNLRDNEETTARLVLSYYYSVKMLRNEIEAAYLALYDNGRSLHLLPVRSVLTLDGAVTTALDVHPWGNLQMLVYGGEDFIRRFFDPDFHLEILKQPLESSQSAAKENEEKPLLPELELSRNITPVQPDAKSKAGESAEKASDVIASADAEEGDMGVLSLRQVLEKELFAENPRFEFLSQLRSAITPSIRGGVMAQIRSSFDSLTSGYQESSLRMNDYAEALQNSLRIAASQVETLRSRLVNTDDTQKGGKDEFLAKISYPRLGATVTEYRYFQLSPFFWMGVFAALSLFFTGFSLITGQVRYEWAVHSISGAVSGKEAVLERGGIEETANVRLSTEECLLWLGIVMLLGSVFITFIGGAMRAWITGWAPVTNMYETIVLMAFCIMLLGLGFTLAPFLSPIWRVAWRYTAFPSFIQIIRILSVKSKSVQPGETDGQQAMRDAAEQFGVPGGMSIGEVGLTPADTEEERQNQIAQRTLLWQSALSLPRILLMFLSFFLLIQLSYQEYAHRHGVFAAAAEMLGMSDIIDWSVVVASVALIVWYVPRFLLSCFAAVFVLFRPALAAAEEGIVSAAVNDASGVSKVLPGKESEMGSVFQGEINALAQVADNSGIRWLNMVRNQILDRKLFALVAAAIALAAGLAAYFNTAQFNPDIRPLAAVLRSNFWLTAHVVAIIISYAAGLAAWGMSAVSLGWIIFGRYQYFTSPNGRSRVLFPAMSEMFAPMIHKLLQIALVMLILGTVLGARWADYSWGRFWSWDPKEVWALITILFYAAVLHGRIAQWYGKVGIMLGALFASIAVIVTWYGINFVFKGSIHSYGGSENTGATFFLWGFIIVNILWAFFALFRYSTEVFGRDTAE